MLNLSGIVQDSIVDGPGLRIAIFAQGCPHKCTGCHNPETWDFSGGTKISVEEVYEIIRQNPLCHGVTFSGGEPFCQAEEFSRLAKMLKADGYEVASYTGYTLEELLALNTPAVLDLLQSLDILIDGRFEIKNRSLELLFKGSTNQRILDVEKSLTSSTPVLSTDPRWLGE